MKIAVATDNFIDVTGHVGRCRGFLIFDVENGEIKSKEERKNLFTRHGRDANSEGEHEHHHHAEGHGHGHSHSALSEGLSDCSHLICHAAGWRLVEDLTKAGVETIFTTEINAEETVIKFEKGELEINEDGSCHAH